MDHNQVLLNFVAEIALLLSGRDYFSRGEERRAKPQTGNKEK